MIYLISDTHFGLGDYFWRFQEKMHRWNPETNREFYDANEMEALIIRRWNSVVKKEDTVISLGDFAWAGSWGDTDAETTACWMGACEVYKEYLDKLHGYKFLVHGNHDPFDMGDNVLYYGGHMFYLMHDPGKRYELIPKNWRKTEWVIHGHHHWVTDNDDSEKTFYPFINGEKKAINVACDVIDYTPVSLPSILALDIDTIWKMETKIGPIIRKRNVK